MSDNYSVETLVHNRLWKFLELNKYVVHQIVAPGGQAAYSLRYTVDEGKKKIVFPDLLASTDNEIIVGEIKPVFSLNDKKKLLEIKMSEDGELKIIDLVKRLTGISSDKGFSVKYTLIHGDGNSQPDSEIEQYIFPKDTEIIVI